MRDAASSSRNYLLVTSSYYASVRLQSVVRDKTLDSQLTMADHVTTVCCAGY